MLDFPYTEKDLSRNFSKPVLLYGKISHARQTVSHVTINTARNQITALVKNATEQPYQTRIVIEKDNDGTWIDGSCTCSAKTNCEHITATLWAALKADK